MITISPGHWRVGSGASDIVDEVVEARKVVSRVVELLKNQAVPVTSIQDDVSTSKINNISYLVKRHNATQRMVDVSIHFNASGKRVQNGIGTEVLYYDAVTLASVMSQAIAKASGLKNRGAKQRKELTFLHGTTMPAILIEVCFVNSVEDVSCYKQHFEEICVAIASVLANFVGYVWEAKRAELIFSTTALSEKVEEILHDQKRRQQVIDKGIAMQAFLPVWRERQLSDLDFLGLCAMVAKKMI